MEEPLWQKASPQKEGNESNANKIIREQDQAMKSSVERTNVRGMWQRRPAVCPLIIFMHENKGRRDSVYVHSNKNRLIKGTNRLSPLLLREGCQLR